MDDAALIREYVSTGSEKAFAELVERHINLVHSAAVRQVGDAHRAQDVTQAVFVLLAQKARTLSREVILSGWLYRTARYAASDCLRHERRRQQREQYAMETLNESSGSSSRWEEIAPLLDAAMAELDTKDRDAIILRYFNGKSLREVGELLGASEDATQKRVTRAVEKLRQYFTRQGRSVSVPVLTVGLTTFAVQAAPVGLSAIATSAALAAGTVITTSTFTWGAIKIMAWTKLKTVAAVGVVGLTTTAFVVQYNHNQNLASDNAQLTLNVAALRAAADAESSRLRAESDELARLRKDAAEIHKLRGDIARLRQEQATAARLVNENTQLRARLGEQQAAQSEEERAKQAELETNIAKMNYTKTWMGALYNYTKDNATNVPATLDEALAYMNPEALKAFPHEQFEIVYRGKLEGAPDPARTIVIREREVTVTREGKRIKTYGFVDGHTEIKVEPPGGFDAWEQERMAKTSDGQ